MRSVSKLGVVLILPMCGLLVGCSSQGRSTAKLSGKVLLDGTPLEAGTVLVVSEDGALQQRGPITEGGVYTVASAPVGKAKIAIELPPGARIPPGMEKLNEAELTKILIREKMIPEDLPPEVQKAMLAASKVPALFQNPGTSGIRTTVAEGENTFDIKLPSKVPPPPK